PARLEIMDDPTEVYIEIAEGKFHQVRRMCARLGKNVLYLKRVKIGALTLDPSLELGHVKMLTEQDIKKAFSN
ncbi:MAG: 16S rRNA pseudouridine(516) synthase, partial [Clostridia bacterium]|nr:16S rRNA pseudouridine(516) synthase [Clostridia bacterium]